MRKPFLLSLGLAGLLSLSACSGSGGNPTGSPGDGPLLSDPITTFSYSLSGGLMVVHHPKESTYTCLDTLSVPINYPAYDDSTDYSIQNGILIMDGRRTGVRSKSRAVVKLRTEYQRVGAGAGLEGRWRLTRSGYTVVSGTLVPEEIQEDARLDAYWAWATPKYMISEMEILPGKVHQRGWYDWPALIVAIWNGQAPAIKADDSLPQSQVYDIEARVGGKNAILWVGKRNGETVRAEMEGSVPEKITYTSSNPAHPTYLVTAETRKACKSDEPAWFEEFKEANRKTTP